MKITIEIENKAFAELVCRAITDAAYEYDVKREEMKEAYGVAQANCPPGPRREHRLHYLARKGAEAKVTSDTLWNVAAAIKEQAAQNEEG